MVADVLVKLLSHALECSGEADLINGHRAQGAEWADANVFCNATVCWLHLDHMQIHKNRSGMI